MAFIKMICLSHTSGEDTAEVDCANAVAGHGLEGDRYYKSESPPSAQITLIESEEIDRINEATQASLPYYAFRRNLITEGIRLNNLVGHTFIVGEVRLLGHELCEPCRYLQERLHIDDLVVRLTHKGGLRCEILGSGKISTGDLIQT